MEPHRVPIKIDTSIDCSVDCLMCLGEACNLCGSGCWSYVKNCEHDMGERHETPPEASNIPVLVRTEDFGGPAVSVGQVPTPHELYQQAGGDQQKYHDLMIQHGLLIDRKDSPPEPHVFKGLTPACACEDCGGGVAAHWHVHPNTSARLTDEERRNLQESIWTDESTENERVDAALEKLESEELLQKLADETNLPADLIADQLADEGEPPFTRADEEGLLAQADYQEGQIAEGIQLPPVAEPPKSVGEKLDDMQLMAQRALEDLRQKRAGTRKVSHAGVPPLQTKAKKAPPFKGECTCPPEGAEWDGPCDYCRAAYEISITAFESGFPCSICKGEAVHEEGCREKRRQDMIEKIFDGEPIYKAGSEQTVCFRCHKPIERGSGAILTSKGEYHMRPCQGAVAA